MPPRKTTKAQHPDYPKGCVFAYLRVSTDEQATSGAGLDAQRHAVTTYADRAGLSIARWVVDEGVSGSIAPEKRPALAEAMLTLAQCDQGVLVFAKLDRITRSARHWLELRDRAQAEGWGLVAADGSVDTVSPIGRMMAGVLATFAEFERDLIRQRTRDALQARKASGVRLGANIIRLPNDVRHRIVDLHEGGQSLNAIARLFNAEGVPTATPGAKWYASTIQRVIRSVALDREAERLRREATPPKPPS